MGINVAALHLFKRALELNVSFRSTLMLGRQTVNVDATHIVELFPQIPTSQANDIVSTEYAEEFFKAIGANEVSSMDASRYEGASILWDLNEEQSLDAMWNLCGQRFSVVFDGGTLEHVFDFKAAMSNCMKMVKCGGHFLGMMPCNNQPGHGFYQFSPELMFRVFTEANGFVLEKMFIVEHSESGNIVNWNNAKDPAGLRREFTTEHPTCLLVIARKFKHVQPFKKVPQQSDYEATWKEKK